MAGSIFCNTTFWCNTSCSLLPGVILFYLQHARAVSYLSPAVLLFPLAPLSFRVMEYLLQLADFIIYQLREMMVYLLFECHVAWKRSVQGIYFFLVFMACRSSCMDPMAALIFFILVLEDIDDHGIAGNIFSILFTSLQKCSSSSVSTTASPL